MKIILGDIGGHLDGVPGRGYGRGTAKRRSESHLQPFRGTCKAWKTRNWPSPFPTTCSPWAESGTAPPSSGSLRRSRANSPGAATAPWPSSPNPASAIPPPTRPSSRPGPSRSRARVLPREIRWQWSTPQAYPVEIKTGGPGIFFGAGRRGKIGFPGLGEGLPDPALQPAGFSCRRREISSS